MQDRRQSPIAIPPTSLFSTSSSTPPRRPAPQREQQSSDDTVRRVPSSYFSLPYSYSSPAGPSQWRSKPLDGGVSARRRDGKGAFRSASVKTVGSFSLKTPNRNEDLDNWQSLHDITGSDVDEDQTGDKATNSRSSSLATPSTRSVRSFFISSDVSADALSIPEGRSHPSERISIIDRLSLSPDQLEAGGDHSLSLSRDDSQGEGTPRASVLPLQSPESIERPTPATPLLEASLPSHFLSSEQPITETRSIVEKKVSTLEGHRHGWILPTWATNILKCSIAYLIASLFTFVPALASILSTQSETDAHGRVTAVPAYSAHMVATIVVYFNPAKTLGNMFLSTRYCFVLAVLSTVVSLLATLTIRAFDHYSPSHGERWDFISEMGDWIVCIIWIGGTMGVLAWSKLWVGNPSFNSGCSMAAMILYNVVIKEGAVPKLIEILLIVFTGVCITNLVCITVAPVSATSNLQKSISKSLNSFSRLLDLLTSTFLLEKSTVKEKGLTLKDAVRDHSAAFKTLQKDLSEAKHERALDGRIRGRKLQLYDAAIVSLGRLAQHLSSLRSSTRLQESLVRASREGRISLEVGAERGHAKISISEVGTIDDERGQGLSEDMDIATSVRLFLKFREIAGAQMDDLNTRCDQALEAVQALSQARQMPYINLPLIRSKLAISLKEFTLSSSRAIKRVYAGPRREKGVYFKADSSSSHDGESGSDEESEKSYGARSKCKFEATEDLPLEDQPDINHGPNETVFWIYFFLFTFEEFAREMIFLLDTMEEIVSTEKVTFWEHLKTVIMPKRARKEKKSEYLYKQLQNIVPIDPSQLQPPLYPKNGRGSTGPVIVPDLKSLSFIGRIKQMFWALGERSKQPDARYAIKTGLGGAMLAAPAFTEIGRPIFLRFRGEWALIAYFATMSQTIGQTNFLSMMRILGTLIGAGAAVLFTKLFPDDNVALPILGFFFSIPCFYIITQMPDYMNAGRFILLTYNLTCLYTYNTRTRGDVTVELIAYRRSTGVIVGVLWAAIVSRYWWPFTARRELRMGLSDFCLDLSYLYSKLLTTYSNSVDHNGLGAVGTDTEEGELEPLLPPDAIGYPHLDHGVRQFMAMELHLQSQLDSMKNLLAHTKNEPRLKGPFAYGFYKEVLLSCERMLDRLHSMRCVTTRDEWDNSIRDTFVIPVNKERREMAGNVILYFYTLSAGFRLRTPVPPYLPPAEEARQRLVDAIRSLDVVRRRSVRGGGRHLLFFAYTLAMQEVIAELEYLGAMMQEAFGVISVSSADDFEDLFEEPIKESVKVGENLKRL
ncbi:hypothetical protein C361_04943 [Cryptococcus neoformans Tu259-1]|uniref:Integral membrane bound transporter domain-containing protein n=1 Tax=Cryptococcus neoformans Tu259-1 TaxID=1230072 RepID=A0A854Q9G7_CRYNE|nr:hypothetical protein C361_04943 [Cryptococcus neoformans var. grubii Tu259-1]